MFASQDENESNTPRGMFYPHLNSVPCSLSPAKKRTRSKESVFFGRDVTNGRTNYSDSYNDNFKNNYDNSYSNSNNVDYAQSYELSQDSAVASQYSNDDFANRMKDLNFQAEESSQCSRFLINEDTIMSSDGLSMPFPPSNNKLETSPTKIRRIFPKMFQPTLPFGSSKQVQSSLLLLLLLQPLLLL